ncbi:hypothetical protein K456DRAFT_38315 [Colletotrichum gloeosporioides 23]|nr:hypothetical protein K456DRAFT_38315 [Colletotrichum gloeosporioides 23]
MSGFCRRSDVSSDDDENLTTLSELSNPPGRARASLSRRSRGSSLGSLSCSVSEHPTLIDYPTLPVPVNMIPTIRSDQSQHSASLPDPLPVPLVRDILRSVPSLDMSNEEYLQLKFTHKRYKCDGIDIWLQAIDPETGDSLIHAIVRPGRIGALGACPLYPACGNGPAQFQGRRERHILFRHQNGEGDNGLHVAARMGELRLPKAVLRAFGGRDTDDGVDVPGEYA